MLVDRPTNDEYLYSAERGGPSKSISLPSRLLLGGYEDFLDSPPVGQEGAQGGRSLNRLGLLNDLRFYWCFQVPESFNPANPSLHALAYYPLRIVAAEWMKYAGIMYRAVKQFEYSTSVKDIRDELEKLNSDMRALQRWRRGSMSSEHKIEAIIRMLKAERPGVPPSSDSASLIEDFEYILATVQKLGRHLESMLPVVTSLVQIIDSRRSFDETANVSRLTIMALIFVPLAYISSLFSMSEQLGPGGPYFWVYFVVAIPLTVAVVLVAKLPLGMLERATCCVRWRRGSAQGTNVIDHKGLMKTEV